VELPEDAAPLDQQVYRFTGIEGKHFDTARAEYEGFAYEYAMEPPVMMNADGEWAPAAADRWELSDDGRTWTFYLRQGAMYSDGVPVTADDWVWSFQRYLDPEMNNVYAWSLFSIENAEAYNMGEVGFEEVGVKKIDDYTFSLTTSEPIPYFLFTIVRHIAPIPKHMWDQYGEDWANNPETAPSNGFFRIAEWNRGKNVIFTLNPYYNGPWKPKLEKLEMVIVPQVGAPLLQMYQAGDVDGGVPAIGDMLVQVLEDPQLSKEAFIAADPRLAYLYFNQREGVFTETKVRQAIAHAVDREAICNDVMRGTCVPAYGLLPLGFPCQRDDPELIENQKYDPELAQQLLAEAGYPNGEGFPELILYTKEGEYLREAEAVQRMLKDNLGITVEPQNFERAIYVDKMRSAELLFALNRWGADFLDPSNFTDWWSDPAASYYTGWQGEEYLNLIDTARSMPVSQERCDMYHEASKILSKEAIGMFLLNPKIGWLFKDYLGDVPLTDRVAGDLWLSLIISQTYVKQH